MESGGLVSVCSQSCRLAAGDEAELLKRDRSLFGGYEAFKSLFHAGFGGHSLYKWALSDEVLLCFNSLPYIFIFQNCL